MNCWNCFHRRGRHERHRWQLLSLKTLRNAITRGLRGALQNFSESQFPSKILELEGVPFICILIITATTKSITKVVERHLAPPSYYVCMSIIRAWRLKNLGGYQGLLYHRTCKPDFLCSWPSLNSYLNKGIFIYIYIIFF